MAISLPHFWALKELSERGHLPKGGSILQIGQANIYDQETGDALLADANGNDVLLNKILGILENRGQWMLWELADCIYTLFMQPKEIVSIDLHGTPDAIQTDLNHGLWSRSDAKTWERIPFDVVFNHGTAEHIFNIANAFQVMHENCNVGGLMIHESPCTGWVDHGFYTLQPTLFYDLAHVNNYEIVYFAIEHIDYRLLRPVKDREEIHQWARDGKLPYNAMLFVALRKTSNDAFKIPMQGVYAGSVSQQTQEAWRALR